VVSGVLNCFLPAGAPHCAGVTEDFAFASSDLAAAGPTGSSSAGLEASTAVQLSSSSSNESDDTFETDELEFVLDTTKQHVDRVDDFSQTSRALHHLCRSESVECARRSSLRTRSSSTSLSLSPSHCCSDSDCDNLWCDASNSKRVKYSADADRWVCWLSEARDLSLLSVQATCAKSCTVILLRK